MLSRANEDKEISSFVIINDILDFNQVRMDHKVYYDIMIFISYYDIIVNNLS